MNQEDKYNKYNKYKNYRIKEENNKFYPQYRQMLMWRDFTKSEWYASDWCTFTISFDTLEEAKQFIKDKVQKEEQEANNFINKMKNLDLKCKFHSID